MVWQQVAYVTIIILLWLNKSANLDHHMHLSVHEYHANMPEEISIYRRRKTHPAQAIVERNLRALLVGLSTNLVYVISLCDSIKCYHVLRGAR